MAQISTGRAAGGRVGERAVHDAAVHEHERLRDRAVELVVVIALVVAVEEKRELPAHADSLTRAPARIVGQSMSPPYANENDAPTVATQRPLPHSNNLVCE